MDTNTKPEHAMNEAPSVMADHPARRAPAGIATGWAALADKVRPHAEGHQHGQPGRDGPGGADLEEARAGSEAAEIGSSVAVTHASHPVTAVTPPLGEHVPFGG